LMATGRKATGFPHSAGGRAADIELTSSYI
jgi:hypothetical protein